MHTYKVTPSLDKQRVVLALLFFVMVGLAWSYLIWMSSSMTPHENNHMANHAHVFMPSMTSAHTMYAGWLFVMWSAMSVAMMLPTALPMVMLFSRFWRGRHPLISPIGPTLLLVLGYLGVWIGFGFVAALLQLWFENLQLITPVMGKIKSSNIGGLVLIGAGFFQLTPLKKACLSKCRTPMMFLNTSWREGLGGPFIMGLNHGIFCLGCCWALMLLMFVLGVMSLLWMAALAVLMLAEKILPRGDILAIITGYVLIGCGVFMLFV